MFNNFDGIIFSNDANVLYNIRNICSEEGIFLEYSKTSEHLLLHILCGNGGLIFVDYNSLVNIQGIIEYICSDRSHKFTFVFLSDNKEVDIALPGNCFVSTQDKLRDILPRLKYLHSGDYRTTNLSRGEVYKNIVTFLDMYGISPKHLGYSYIKECIAIGVEQGSGALNFSNNIYPVIATKFNTCTGNVDKNIRTAIRSAYEHNPKLFEIDAVHSTAITNAEFLNYVIEKVKFNCIQ